MREALPCPKCNYTLEGLGDDTRVRCPECGARLTWDGIRWWQREGRFIPKEQTAYFLLGAPAIMLIVNVISPPTAGTKWQSLALLGGWGWSTAILAILFYTAARRHGGGFGALLTLIAAPSLGAVFTAILAIFAGDLLGFE